MTQIQLINDEINREIFADPATVKTYLAMIFPGFDEKQMKQAIFDMKMRGVSLDDIGKRRVYAIKYGERYNIIFSIDHARAIGMKSGVVSVEAPIYEEKDGKIISCTVTVKRKVDDYIGSFTDTAFFDEYNTGRNLWAKMPRRMIAKVAEMAALRKACPEELDKAYSEEEMGQAVVIEGTTPETEQIIAGLTNIKNVNDLKEYYNEHKGLGKAFDKAVSARKKDLEAQDLRGSDPTESRVVPEEGA